MDRPVIGIIGCNKHYDGEPVHAVKDRYVRGVAEFANAAALIVPSIGRPEDAASIVGRLDGILLTGSTSNMEPARYRGTGEGQGPHDPARDKTSIALIKAARHFGVPVFGVCRGFQEINVALGGTLVDERDTDSGGKFHHAEADDLETQFAHVHKVEVSPASTLSRIVGAREIEVNSVHFQRVGELGEGLRVEAVAPDGVVEAFTSREAQPLIFAVQWHPEWRPEETPHHIAYWRQLGETVRNAAAARQALGNSVNLMQI